MTKAEIALMAAATRFSGVLGVTYSDVIRHAKEYLEFLKENDDPPSGYDIYRQGTK